MAFNLQKNIKFYSKNLIDKLNEKKKKEKKTTSSFNNIFSNVIKCQVKFSGGFHTHIKVAYE